MAILRDISASEVKARNAHAVEIGNTPAGSSETVEQQLARLRAENAALKAGNRQPQLTLKVSEKGALSIYGLGRFPVTLYKEQWLKLLPMCDEIRAFITKNNAQLSSKS